MFNIVALIVVCGVLWPAVDKHGNALARGLRVSELTDDRGRALLRFRASSVDIQFGILGARKLNSQCLVQGASLNCDVHTL